MAVAAGLAFAVGFAPRLADRVTLPHEVAVAPPLHHTQAVPSRARVSQETPARTKAHPAPTPTTIAAPFSGGDSNGGTVVVPARPVVTSGTADDERWSSTSASPTPRESDSQRDSGGDG
jgi:hypothetical protein